jgi:hypothetical protein
MDESRGDALDARVGSPRKGELLFQAGRREGRATGEDPHWGHPGAGQPIDQSNSFNRYD